MRLDQRALPPGSVIGILGGGQLGRMLALAAAVSASTLPHLLPGRRTARPSRSPPRTPCAAYDDEAALEGFAAAVDVVTYEFENVPAETADILARPAAVRPAPTRSPTTPGPARRKRPSSATSASPTADFRRGRHGRGPRRPPSRALGRPSILKTRRFGYDGKGQIMIRPETDARRRPWAASAASRPILEAFVPFETRGLGDRGARPRRRDRGL